MSDKIIPFPRRRDDAPEPEANEAPMTPPEDDEGWTIQIVAKAPPPSR